MRCYKDLLHLVSVFYRIYDAFHNLAKQNARFSVHLRREHNTLCVLCFGRVCLKAYCFREKHDMRVKSHCAFRVITRDLQEIVIWFIPHPIFGPFVDPVGKKIHSNLDIAF